jgi:hypothetical protein
MAHQRQVEHGAPLAVESVYRHCRRLVNGRASEPIAVLNAAPTVQ